MSDTSPEYRAFLNLIGTRVKLAGYDGNRGDLDVSGGTALSLVVQGSIVIAF